ncbi:uncharacterized protein [Oryctolagus cuniculus]|uniref:uncharacterized protein n=1 Tax=Oryctolagus cuniculus TaxID=9986 RepID=UPI0038790281
METSKTVSRKIRRKLVGVPGLPRFPPQLPDPCSGRNPSARSPANLRSLSPKRTSTTENNVSTRPFRWTGGPPPFGSPTAIQPSGIEGGASLCPVPRLNGPRIRGTTTHSPTRPITAKYSPAPPPRAKGRGDYWASQAFPLCSVGGELQYWPFSMSDLYNWKTHNPPFSQDPQALTGLIESILLTHQPTWDDCQQLLQAVLTTEERQWVSTEARKNVPGDDGHPTQLPNEIDEVFPLTRPNWDFNTAAGRERLRLYRQVLLTGLWGAGRCPTNLAKVRAIVQGSEETPAGFLRSWPL